MIGTETSFFRVNGADLGCWSTSWMVLQEGNPRRLLGRVYNRERGRVRDTTGRANLLEKDVAKDNANEGKGRRDATRKEIRIGAEKIVME
jgi:hypothetical protein